MEQRRIDFLQALTCSDLHICLVTPTSHSLLQIFFKVPQEVDTFGEVAAVGTAAVVLPVRLFLTGSMSRLVTL